MFASLHNPVNFTIKTEKLFLCESIILSMGKIKGKWQLQSVPVEH